MSDRDELVRENNELVLYHARQLMEVDGWVVLDFVKLWLVRWDGCVVSPKALLWPFRLCLSPTRHVRVVICPVRNAWGGIGRRGQWSGEASSWWLCVTASLTTSRVGKRSST